MSKFDRMQSFLDRWFPWEEKFAWWPVIINKRLVWFKPYFERSKVFMSPCTKERTTSIFDVLKS